VTANTVQTFKVKGSKVISQRDVTYQQLKHFKSGTDRLTDFERGEAELDGG